ncbi:MAG: cupin domain-containing protein [Bauldia sp.]|nr:cupin domain-containing protein [Bauldia sp.]
MAGRTIRRVVTGTTAEGRTAFVSDTVLETDTIAMMPDAGFTGIWGADTPPTLPTDGTKPDYGTWFPPAAGYRVEMITIPPASTPAPADLDTAAAAAEMEKKLPGLLGHMDPHHPGMHQTDTIDFVYVTSGRCVVELDSGDRTELGPGDILIQNGTRHAWRVPFEEPCTVLSISVGATRRG